MSKELENVRMENELETIREWEWVNEGMGMGPTCSLWQ